MSKHEIATLKDVVQNYKQLTTARKEDGTLLYEPYGMTIESTNLKLLYNGDVQATLNNSTAPPTIYTKAMIDAEIANNNSWWKGGRVRRTIKRRRSTKRRSTSKSRSKARRNNRRH